MIFRHKMIFISGRLFYDKYPVLRHPGYLSWFYYLSRNGCDWSVFVFFSWREVDVYCDWFVAALFSVDNQYPRYCNSCQSVVILLSVYTKATNFNETTPCKSFTVNNKYFKKQKYIFATWLSAKINEEVAIGHNTIAAVCWNQE